MERDDFQFAFQAELEASLRPEGEPTHEKAIMLKPADYPLGKLRYMVKGVSRQTASKLGISKIAYQGEVDGKRASERGYFDRPTCPFHEPKSRSGESRAEGTISRDAPGIVPVAFGRR
jgi:hypothetical protein